MKKILCLLILAALLTGCAAPAVPQTSEPPVVTGATEATQPSEPAATEPAPTEPAPTEPPAPVDTLTVHFIDVGQADCALLECDGKFALIDGGNALDGELVVNYLAQQGVEKLELVVGSHIHEDHIGGLPAVLNAYPVDTVWTGSVQYYNAIVNAFLDAAAAQQKSAYRPKVGTTYQLGSAQITVLGPVRDFYQNINDTSLVLMVSYKDTRFLFTGDMTQLSETDLLDYWGEEADLHADVLKVGHHGSYTSTGYRLLNTVMPTFAVISCGGNNDYGHPHDEPLSRLQDARANIYRTDKMYSIVAVSDGQEITFSWGNQYAKPWIPAE